MVLRRAWWYTVIMEVVRNSPLPCGLSLSLWGQLTQITVHRAMSKALMIGFVCAWCQTWCSVYIFSFSVCVCERQWKQLPKVLVCFVILLDFHKSHWCILTGNLFFLLYWIKSDFFFYIWKILVWKNITNLQKAKAELLLLKVSMHFVLYLLRLGF